MTYALIEQEIITQLLPIREELGIVVQCLPELPSSWGSVAGTGWVSVQWLDSELEGYSLGEQSAEEVVNYKLDIRVKALRSSLYTVLNKLKELLWGFKPSLCYRPITVNKFNFLGMAEDYWVAQGGFTAYVYGGYSQQKIDYAELPNLQGLQVGNVFVGETDD
ncbi:Gp37 family protein [Geminocystis sp. NIES-3709]|uniref:Gp37 family protein n=1 Tax=Geminocystis sp. NIES-3709 TaxID=1617448 RepID=UPI0005FCBD4D|nr:Gp37 family protein [Geminocystis sp. NIES-3709]BAQ65524.1 hypothetical protein GM3709_2289 [Geminocystis sp. NIES-3709]